MRSRDSYCKSVLTYQRLNSDYQGCQQVPLPMEPSPLPFLFSSSFFFLNQLCILILEIFENLKSNYYCTKAIRQLKVEH